MCEIRTWADPEDRFLLKPARDLLKKSWTTSNEDILTSNDMLIWRA